MNSEKNSKAAAEREKEFSVGENAERNQSDVVRKETLNVSDECTRDANVSTEHSLRTFINDIWQRGTLDAYAVSVVLRRGYVFATTTIVKRNIHKYVMKEQCRHYQ
ncbi:hypothetical protein JOB18_019794 [Solea senegalensis]|uniref:Uncharacterized protein n=1 Tax=Solea senegalensis TaxID=28829 RepID=A0AAV6S3K7_SOLSE|nr:hypothetical protein JOB18_019794 [Solea senegalensis]